MLKENWTPLDMCKVKK